MPKINPVGPIEGIEDFWTLIAFLGDQKAYAARLKKLEDTALEINVAIQRAGGAEKIDSLLIQAQGDRQMAAEELQKAKAEATKILEDAKQEQRQSAAYLATGQVGLVEEKKELDKQRRAWEVQQETRERVTAEAQAASRRLSEESQAAMARATAIQTEFEDKLRRLNAGLAAVSGG